MVTCPPAYLLNCQPAYLLVGLIAKFRSSPSSIKLGLISINTASIQAGIVPSTPTTKLKSRKENFNPKEKLYSQKKGNLNSPPIIIWINYFTACSATGALTHMTDSEGKLQIPHDALKKTFNWGEVSERWWFWLLVWFSYMFSHINSYRSSVRLIADCERLTTEEQHCVKPRRSPIQALIYTLLLNFSSLHTTILPLRYRYLVKWRWLNTHW